MKLYSIEVIIYSLEYPLPYFVGKILKKNYFKYTSEDADPKLVLVVRCNNADRDKDTPQR